MAKARDLASSPMLWVDKYEPRTLQEIRHRPKLSLRLQRMTKSAEMSHMLFFGGAGVGKLTWVNALLHHLYGQDAWRVQLQSMKSGRWGVVVLRSNVHFVVSPSAAGTRDRQVIEHLVKETVQIRPFTNQHQVVVIREADRLSRAAQESLRRTMEVYSTYYRFILIARRSSHVIEPLRSRCCCIRVPALSVEDIDHHLSMIVSRERLSVSASLVSRIAAFSEHDVRRAVCTLQVVCTSGSRVHTSLPRPRWESALQRHVPLCLADPRTHLLSFRTLVQQICAAGVEFLRLMRLLVHFCVQHTKHAGDAFRIPLLDAACSLVGVHAEGVPRDWVFFIELVCCGRRKRLPRPRTLLFLPWSSCFKQPWRGKHTWPAP